MTDLLAEIKQLQGLEEKKKRNWLPQVILVIATLALVVVMTIRFQHKYEKAERNEAPRLQPAVLIKKLSDSSSQVQAAEVSKQSASGRSEALAEAAAAAAPESGSRTHALGPGPPEQPDLEKAIDMLMKRRSPKY